MNKTRSMTLSLGLATVLVAAPWDASAQLSWEGRVGSSIATGELTKERLNQTAGFSAAVDGMFGLNNVTTAYAGVSRQAFNCNGCATDVTTTGFNGGLKLVLGGGTAMPWFRGGLMLHRAEIDDDPNDWGVGVDAGAGIDWNVTPALSFVPALRVNSYASGPVSLTYLTFDMGLHVHPSQIGQ